MRIMSRVKQGTAFLLAVILTTVMGTQVWAAENRTKITSIRLKISSNVETGSYGGDIDVTTTSTNFTVGEVEIQNDNDEWEIGDVPKVKVYLYAKDAYYFSSTGSSVFTLTGDSASYVTAKTEDSKSTMILTFKLDALEGDLYMEDAEWDENSGEGSWSDVDGAKSYEVRLYRGNSSVTSILTTSNTSFNFSGYITKTGDYTFRVRAVASSSNKGEWVESNNWYIDSDSLTQVSAGASSSGGVGSSISTGGSWQQDGKGWWFRKSDGTWPANAWMKSNSRWYYFNANGYMATGWINWNNAWYFCDRSTGAMYENTKTPDGYTVGAGGVWLGY